MLAMYDERRKHKHQNNCNRRRVNRNPLFFAHLNTPYLVYDSNTQKRPYPKAWPVERSISLSVSMNNQSMLGKLDCHRLPRGGILARKTQRCRAMPPEGREIESGIERSCAYMIHRIDRNYGLFIGRWHKKSPLSWACFCYVVEPGRIELPSENAPRKASTGLVHDLYLAFG